jgi:hypothetical protein
LCEPESIVMYIVVAHDGDYVAWTKA